MARYIDAELAKAEFTGNFQDRYATAHIKALIDSTPTADVQPVVHGEWISDKICSNCNSDIYSMLHGDIEGVRIELPNYCPYCNARMDGDTNDT